MERKRDAERGKRRAGTNKFFSLFLENGLFVSFIGRVSPCLRSLLLRCLRWALIPERPPKLDTSLDLFRDGELDQSLQIWMERDTGPFASTLSLTVQTRGIKEAALSFFYKGCWIFTCGDSSQVYMSSVNHHHQPTNWLSKNVSHVVIDAHQNKN